MCLFEGGGVASLWRHFGRGVRDLWRSVTEGVRGVILPWNCVTSFMDVSLAELMRDCSQLHSTFDASFHVGWRWRRNLHRLQTAKHAYSTSIYGCTDLLEWYVVSIYRHIHCLRSPKIQTFYQNLSLVAEYHVVCWQTLQWHLLWRICGATNWSQ